MATLTVTQLLQSVSSSAGVAMSVAGCSSGGDKFLNTGREILVFQATSSNSANGTACVVTVAAQAADSYGQAAASVTAHNIVASVAASSAFGLTVLGPFPPSLYNDSNGFVNISYSVALPANSGFNVGVFSVAPRS